MSNVFLTGRAPSPSSFWQHLSGLAQRHAKYRAYHSTAKTLAKLTNHELHDIGLERCDIHDIARRTAYGA